MLEVERRRFLQSFRFLTGLRRIGGVWKHEMSHGGAKLSPSSHHDNSRVSLVSFQSKIARFPLSRYSTVVG